MRRTKPIPKTSLKIKRSSAGLGLFATTPISPGEYIEYTGEIITTEKANKMVGARYLFEINSKWTIQGAGRENLARYINYSCKPNCESIQDGKRVFIKALHPIKPGEELTYDYGDEYFNEFIKPFGCRCQNCLKKIKGVTGEEK
jgi:SET domain-containing protein